MTAIDIFIHDYPILCIFVYGVGALLIGSVLTMLSYRLPMMMTQPHAKRFNLFFPRSHCTHCKKMIPIYHNIPIVSYCLLRGHCHACREAISWRYPCTEAITLIVSLGALYVFGWHGVLAPVLLFLWIAIVLTLIDLEHQILPDVLTYCLLWLGLLVNSQNLFCPLSAAVWGAVIAYLSLWLLIKLFYLITGKIGMGNGDFKLLAALGAWFGWAALLPILLLSCTLGICIGSFYLWLNKKNRHHPIPFGPYLCIAGTVYLFHPISIWM